MGAVVSPPTNEEFCKLFISAGSGAFDGIVHLRILDPFKDVNAARVASGLPRLPRNASPECIEKVCELYRYVQNKLEGMGRSRLLPDIIHFEHLLCKVLRISRLELYNLFRSSSFRPIPIKNKKKGKDVEEDSD